MVDQNLIVGRRSTLGLSRESITIDPGARTYRATRGIIPFARQMNGEITDTSRIILQTRMSVNLIGDPVRLGACWFEDGGQRWRLMAGDLDFVTTAAYEFAGRLRIPVESAYSTSTPLRQSTRILTWSTWVAMMGVILMMLWPVLSGSRPMRFIDWNQSWSNYQESPASRAYRDGLSAYYRSDFEQAERLMRDALKDRPHDGEILNMLAYAYVGQNKLDEALDTANRALAAAPRNGNIADTVAEMHQRRGEFKEAARMYEESLSLQQNAGIEETHTKYGETLIALGRRSDGIKHLTRAMQMAMGNSQWANRARQVLSGKVTDYRKP